MEVKPSYKELLHTMEFEPYKLKYVDWDDREDNSSDEDSRRFGEETDEDEEIEFEIDEDAFRCSNGISKSENDLEIDIRIDLEDFNIDYQVCNNILAIFGTKKPSTKNILIQNFEDIIDPSVTSIISGGSREYKTFCHPILLPENADTKKIHTEIIEGTMHVKIPKNSKNLKDDILENCAMCQWKECFNKHFPGFAEL